MAEESVPKFDVTSKDDGGQSKPDFGQPMEFDSSFDKLAKAEEEAAESESEVETEGQTEEAENPESGEQTNEEASEGEEGESEENVEEGNDADAELAKSNPKFSKALQKAQQDNAALRRELSEIKELLLGNQRQGQQAEQAKAEASPFEDLDKSIGELDKLDGEEIVTAKQFREVAKNLRQATEKAFAAVKQKAEEVEGRTSAQDHAVQHEKTWKAQNPQIQDKYTDLIKQAHQDVQASFPNIQPGTPEYAAAWHTAHRFLTNQAKATVSQTKPAATQAKSKPSVSKPSNGARKPLPSGVKTVGKAAVTRQEATETDDWQNVGQQPDPRKFFS